MIQSLEGLLAGSALPNLHAAVIHFPIALLAVALLLDLACLVIRKWVWLDRTATLLYLLGTIAAAAAFLTGRVASEEMWQFPSEAQVAMADHHSPPPAPSSPARDSQRANLPAQPPISSFSPFSSLIFLIFPNHTTRFLSIRRRKEENGTQRYSQ